VTSRLFAGPALDVTRRLIGKRLVHETPDGITGGLIVEVEAYIGEDDPACHAAPGPTPRNVPLYGPPGISYVYFNYGVHWMVNVVAEPAGSPAAILIRAIEPEIGLDLMRARRARVRQGSPAGTVPSWTGRDADLCRGPGNLTRALAITGAQNQLPLTTGALRIESPSRAHRAWSIEWSPRIGIRVGTEHLWRAYVPGHPSVSGRPR